MLLNISHLYEYIEVIWGYCNLSLSGFTKPVLKILLPIEEGFVIYDWYRLYIKH